MKSLIALALLVGSAQASAASVEVADGKWNHLPQLKRAGHAGMSANAVTRIHQLVAKGECSMPGQSRKRLDMTVPFVVHYAPDGTLNRIVIKRLGCAEAEGIVGGSVLELVESGEYKSTGTNSEGWYRGVISFSSET